MKRLILAAVLGAAALFALPAFGETFSFGVSGDSAGGCELPDVVVGYEREGFHGRVKQGGNRACRSATSVDIEQTVSHGALRAVIGYDQRGVSFSGPSVEGPDDVFYGSMSAVTAAVAYAFGDFTVGWNVPAEAPRLGFDGSVRGFDVEASVERYPSADGVFAQARVSRHFGPVEVFAQVVHGIGNVADPVSWRSDSGRTPADPPERSYAFGLLYTWSR